MGKSSPSPPPAPDPAATAAAQGAANKEAVRESALVNQINEITPYGSLTYSGAIGSPDRTRTVSLNPQDQETLDQQRAVANALTGFAGDKLGQVQTALGQPFNFEGIPEIPGANDLNDAATHVEQATFDRGLNLLRPAFDRQERRMDVDMVNRGLPRSGEAFTGESERFDDTRNRALEDLALASVGAGRAEQSRLFNLGQTARQQAINERLAERSQPLNELAALLQGSPATQGPQFAAPAQYQVAPADITGAINTAYGGALNAFNTQQQARSANLGGLYGLAGSLGSAAIMGSMLCARDLKTNGRPVETILPRIEALTVEAWDYLPGVDDGGTHIGPYADEWKRLLGLGDGRSIHVVDAFGVCLKGIQELSAKVRVLEAAHAA